MSDPSNNDDDLLLLTMRVETDENSLSELNKRMLALRETMQDTAKTIDLSDWATSLGAAVNALRAAVNAWNSLEDKAIGVATARNYLPYGISAGEAESINTKIDANKIAQQTGLSSGEVLSSLIRISEEQQNVVGLGHNPNQDNWVALYELGRALGDERFTGANLSHLLTSATSVEVLTAISDLLAKANRKAYSMPEGSEQRQSWIKMINKVQDSPYVPANLETYLALLTKPENQTWGKSGDPFKQLISGTPEDIGNYNKNIEEEGAKALSVHSALSALKTEREEFWNRTGTSAYNTIGENVILPLSNTITTLAKSISGKAMSNMPFEGYSNWQYFSSVNPYDKAKMEKDKFSSSALLDETGTVFKGDLKARASQAKQYATGTVFKDAIPGDSGLYELAKAALVRNVTSKMTYSEGKKKGKRLSDEDADDAAEEMLTGESGFHELAKAALVRNVTSKMTYSEGKKKGKHLSDEDAYAAAEEILTSEDSPYAQEYKSGGFTGLYSELHKKKVLTDNEYRTLIERVSTETEHKERNEIYNDVVNNSEDTLNLRETEHKELKELYSDVATNSEGTTKARDAQHKELKDAIPGDSGLQELAKASLVRNVTSKMTYSEGKKQGKRLSDEDAYAAAEEMLTEESGLHELAKVALVRNVTSKMTYSEGKKKGKHFSDEDAYAAAEEMLTSEESSYAQAYKVGGFTGLYSELHKKKVLTDNEYRTLIERVSTETEHKELKEIYSDVATNSEGTAKARDAQHKELKEIYSDVATNSEGTAKARDAQAKQYSTGMEDALLGELGLYELAKVSQADFNVQSVTAMMYARDALVRNVTSKMTYSEGKKQGKRLSSKDAYDAAEEMLTSEDSPYVQAYKVGGFTGLYAELYKTQSLTDKEYLALMERVINETKHKELNKFYRDVDPNSEVTADVRKVDGQNVLRLELTVKDEKTGEVTTQKTDLTPDQVSSLRLNLGL